jgi:hypothetical protein
MYLERLPAFAILPRPSFSCREDSRRESLAVFVRLARLVRLERTSFLARPREAALPDRDFLADATSALIRSINNATLKMQIHFRCIERSSLCNIRYGIHCCKAGAGLPQDYTIANTAIKETLC